MAIPGGSSEGGAVGQGATGGSPGGATGRFFAELASAFRRLRPQGTDRWNFAAAFTKLDQAFGPEYRPAAGDDAGTGDEAAPVGVAGGEGTGGVPAAGAPEPPARGKGKELVHRHVLDRLRPWVGEVAEAAARRALRAELGRVEDGLESATEALRFLAARVETMEDDAARRHDPVDGMAWLAPAPDLAGWVAAVAAWVGAPTTMPATLGDAGAVLHAECGDGAFALALAGAMGAGGAVRGCEPRGAVALEAARAGLDVHLGTVGELLGGLDDGALGGLVLSGVVDRLPLGELVALADLAAGRLAPGAALVVVGTRPEAAAGAWGPVAADLVPGRPLHPETWALLLERAGYLDVGPLPGGGGVDGATFAVGARRPA